MASLVLQLWMWSQGMTNIDRRKCERTVPMEVLVLGLSRTGTSSIRVALKNLGYNETYHAGCVYSENPRDARMWVEAYRAKFHGEGKPFGREEFDKLLGHCMAASDVPCLHFAEELVAAYPTAKIVLSVRDSPAAWLKSMRSTMIPFAKRTYANDLLSRIRNMFVPRLPFQDMNDEMRAAFSEEALYHSNEDTYLEHNEWVRSMAKEKGMEVLELNVKEGWRPLCGFLGKPVPRTERGEEEPFPRVNDTKEMNEKLGMVDNVMNVMVGINVVCTIVGCYVAGRGLMWAWQKYGA